MFNDLELILPKLRGIEKSL